MKSAACLAIDDVTFNARDLDITWLWNDTEWPMIVKLDIGDNYFSCFCVSKRNERLWRNEVDKRIVLGLSYDDDSNITGLGKERQRTD